MIFGGYIHLKDKKVLEIGAGSGGNLLDLMKLGFLKKNIYANEINPENWYKILSRPGVNIGHSDPNADPCGYRSRLVWQLAEKYYGVKGLVQKFTNNCPPENIRPKETDLLALLEAGELDYVFIYRSVAEQHRGQYAVLPDTVNLKSASKADFYKQASLKITGKKPGEWITKVGQPMVYGLTVLKESPNRKLALNFLSFVLSKEGQNILRRNGQPPINPAQVIGKAPKGISDG